MPGGFLTRCAQVTAAAAPECRHQDEVECCCVVGDTVYTGGDDGTIKVDSELETKARLSEGSRRFHNHREGSF